MHDDPGRPRAMDGTKAKDDRANEPPPIVSASADEPDEADGAMETPADVYRSREEIEALRLSEGPLSDDELAPGRRHEGDAAR
jgi:hypothetical protein